jgi:hypothetical protein
MIDKTIRLSDVRVTVDMKAPEMSDAEIERVQRNIAKMMDRAFENVFGPVPSWPTTITLLDTAEMKPPPPCKCRGIICACRLIT